MERFCDLRVHSAASDGTVQPALIPHFAKAAGLSAVALTDKNTTAGLDAFLRSAAATEIRAVPGVEFSTEWNGKELRVLALFPERVEAALADYEPSYIVRYILDVCAAFNRFYHECKILNAEEENARAFRLRLSAATQYTLANALRLICLRAPEKI